MRWPPEMIWVDVVTGNSGDGPTELWRPISNAPLTPDLTNTKVLAIPMSKCAACRSST